MGELDKLRTNHAYEMLEQGRRELTSNPGLGFYHVWSSRLRLIAVHVKNSGNLPDAQVVDFVRELTQIVTEHRIALHLEKQNELLILALAAGDVTSAQRLAEVGCCEGESHPFDRVLNRKLRSAILHVSVPDDVAYRPISSEQAMFLDLDSIIAGRECDLAGADKYWRATRSRRYANTAFEHCNVFRFAFATLTRR